MCIVIICHRFIDGKSLRVSHWHALARRTFRAIRAHPYQRGTLLLHIDTCDVVTMHGIDAGHALASNQRRSSAHRPTKRPIALKHCGIQAIWFNMMFAIVLNDKQAHAHRHTQISSSSNGGDESNVLRSSSLQHNDMHIRILHCHNVHFVVLTSSSVKVDLSFGATLVVVEKCSDSAQNERVVAK
jgi:hypothetical protein